jgi:hypothetical protein
LTQRGNPVNRRKGEVARALIISLVQKRPMPMAEVQSLTGRSRTRILDHCALLQEKRRIVGYSSAGGVLRVWTEERE